MNEDDDGLTQCQRNGEQEDPREKMREGETEIEIEMYKSTMQTKLMRLKKICGIKKPPPTSDEQKNNKLVSLPSSILCKCFCSGRHKKLTKFYESNKAKSFLLLFLFHSPIMRES